LEGELIFEHEIFGGLCVIVGKFVKLNFKIPKQRIIPGEIYFGNSSKYYLKSSLNKLRIALHSILRKDFIVFSKSQNQLG
jgi:hypothetical protein